MGEGMIVENGVGITPVSEIVWLLAAQLRVSGGSGIGHEGTGG
jgi:hypothetical protein